MAKQFTEGIGTPTLDGGQLCQSWGPIAAEKGWWSGIHGPSYESCKSEFIRDIRARLEIGSCREQIRSYTIIRHPGSGRHHHLRSRSRHSGRAPGSRIGWLIHPNDSVIKT